MGTNFFRLFRAGSKGGKTPQNKCLDTRGEKKVKFRGGQRSPHPTKLRFNKKKENLISTAIWRPHTKKKKDKSRFETKSFTPLDQKKPE